MSAEKYRNIRVLGVSAVAAGLLATPVGVAAESDASSPPRPTSAKDFERKNTLHGAFEQDGQTRFGGKITIVGLKKADPEPTPHLLAEEKNDKKPVVKKGLILGKPNSMGYYELPPSPDGAYQFKDPECTAEHWGSKELVTIIYNVSEKWKKQHPQGYLKIGDLNGPTWEHLSHKWGRDFDLNATTNGKDWVANINDQYNQKATIELGKMIADAGKVEFIFFNDPQVRDAINKYKGWPEGEKTQYANNHESHFHVRYDLPYLDFFAPDGKEEHQECD